MADKPVDHNHIIRPDRFTEDEPETFMRFYLPPDEEDEELEDEEWDDDDDFDDEEEVSQHEEEPSVSLLNFHGLNIGIECPAGKPRKPGYEPLAHDYGSIRRTEGKDGDQIDVFIGPFKEHSEVVFVFDQPREDGKTFDEHKVMIGFINQNDAELALRANYPAGWIVGSCTAMTVSQFKAWLGQGDTAKPVEEQVSAFGEGDAPCAPFRVEQLGEGEHEPLEDVANRHHGKPIGATGPLKVKAHRAGTLEDHHGRGVFFGHSAEAVSGYGHPQEHKLHIQNAIHAPGHEELHKHLYGHDFHDAVNKEDSKLMRKPGITGNTLNQAQRNVERRMANKVHKMGHDAIIYTKPSYLKAGKKSGPEVAVIGDAAKRLSAAQHSEDGQPEKLVPHKIRIVRDHDLASHDDESNIQIKPIPIKSIRTHADQREVDQHTVDRMKKHLQSGGKLPPIQVVSHANNTHHLDDGHHRVEAHRQLGHTHIDADVMRGLDVHQHSELQFAEEPAHIKKLREFVQKGTSTKILEALKKIKALKAAGSVGIQTMAGMIEKEIRTLQPLIAQDLTAGMYGSAIQGVKEAVQSLPEQAIPEALPAAGAAAPTPELVLPENITLPALDDAVDVLRASPAAAGVDYKQTAELVRQGAFAITADLADTAVEQVRDILADSLRDGTILPDFIDQVAEKLGTGTLADHHVENIFRTNTMAAFSAGQARALNNPIVNDHFPYASYGATRDARTRKEHKALEKLGLNGTNFYRVDDPTFQKFRPPWDYQCRCVWTPRTVEQAARAGVKEAQDWMDRAKKMATDKGGSFYQYLSAVAPATPEYVKAPEFEPPPEFRKL